MRKKIEAGQFPSEQAVVEHASRLLLIEQPDQGQPAMNPATEPEKENAEEARPWRDVYALEFPAEDLFTKFIDIRLEQLDEWQPRGVASERQVRDDRPEDGGRIIAG